MDLVSLLVDVSSLPVAAMMDLGSFPVDLLFASMVELI